MSVVKKHEVTLAWLNSAANANNLSAGDFYVVQWEGVYQATSGRTFVSVDSVPWDNVTPKPIVIAAGETQLEAQTAIGMQNAAHKNAANTFTLTQSFNGGAKLGESGPTIKQRVITGNMHATAGTAFAVSPGVAISSILAVDMWVTESGGGVYPPDFEADGLTRKYYMRMTSTAIWVRSESTATPLAGMPYRILVTYTA